MQDERWTMQRIRGTRCAIAVTAAIGVAGLGAGLAGCGDGGDGGDGRGGSAAPGPPDDGGGVTDAGFTQALNAAEQRLDTGDRAAAETILATAVRRRPEDPRARELLGRVAMGRAAEAAEQGASAARVRALRATAWEEYRRAVAGRPEDAGLHTSAGLVALSAGEDDAALALFERAATLDPSLPQPRLFAGQIRLGRGDHAAASRDFEAVLALDPGEPYALSSLGLVRLAEGRPDEAMRLAAEAREQAPDDPALRVQEIRIIRRAGQPEAAIARMLAMPPEDRAVMGLTPELAAAHRATGDLEEAAAAWESAWTLLPPGAARTRAALGAATARADLDDIEAAWAWLARARGTAAAAADREEIAALEERLRKVAEGSPGS